MTLRLVLQDALPRQVSVRPLFGMMTPEEQAAALTWGAGDPQMVVVATNIAESSVTVPGVRAVVDFGRHRKPAFNSDSAMDALVTVRVPLSRMQTRSSHETC